MLNTAVVTPMPSAKATTASTDTKRARTAVRAATFRSRISRDMRPSPPLDGTGARDVGRYLREVDEGDVEAAFLALGRLPLHQDRALIRAADDARGGVAAVGTGQEADPPGAH